MITGLRPIECENARLLVLGSIPSAESLRRQEYYGNPRNLFWRLLFAALEKEDPGIYSRRLEALHSHRIALWDVLRTCERSGSLDASIVSGSERPNAIGRFLAGHRTVSSIALNGGKAAQLFRRLVAPTLGATAHHIHIFELPSTSPANTTAFASKLERWRPVLRSTDRAVGALRFSP